MNTYIDILKTKGLKITPRRKAIIGIFNETHTHLTPEQVWNKLRKQFEKCGLPSVYRNLDTLATCCVLTTIQQPDGKKRYALCKAGDHHHHHIICIKCGKVEELKNKCPFEHKKHINGYKILNHFLQINGICQQCART